MKWGNLVDKATHDDDPTSDGEVKYDDMPIKQHTVYLCERTI